MEPITKDRSLSLLTDELLQNGLQGLCSLTELELSMRFGLNDQQSFFLVSLLELGRRQNRMRKEDRVTVRSSSDAGDLFSDLRYLDKEHFVVAFLNTKNQVIGKETMGIGSLNACIVHPRECLRQQSDTARLRSFADITIIEVLDHVVIGDGRHCSLKEMGVC